MGLTLTRECARVLARSGIAAEEAEANGSQIKPEAVLFAFDLLELDGEDLRPMPIEVRKAQAGAASCAMPAPACT